MMAWASLRVMPSMVTSSSRGAELKSIVDRTCGFVFPFRRSFFDVLVGPGTGFVRSSSGEQGNRSSLVFPFDKEASGRRMTPQYAIGSMPA